MEGLKIPNNARTDLILDISFVVALEQIGPVLRGTTSQNITKSKAEAKVVLYLTQRVVFALGIGNQQVKFDRLHGPIELIDLEVDQEVLLAPIKFSDPNSPDPRIQNFGRDVIVCIHYKKENRSLLQRHQEVLFDTTLRLIEELAPEKQYIFLDNEEKVTSACITLRDRLNRFINRRVEGEDIGGSLFNLATLRQLGGNRQRVGSYLMNNLGGVERTQIYQIMEPYASVAEVDAILEELEEMGLAEKVTHNSELKYKPKG